MTVKPYYKYKHQQNIECEGFIGDNDKISEPKTETSLMNTSFVFVT